MTHNTPIITTIADQKILPLFFHGQEKVSSQVVKALYEAGIRAVEFTNRGSTALDTFAQLTKLCARELPGMYMGIGTIKNVVQAKAFVAAGAQFLISPGYVPELAAYAIETGVLYIPGCMTIQEIIAAENAGISFIKLFPANMLGTTFLKNIKPLFPDLLFMPTGGIETKEEALAEWFDLGVTAVGLGSSLLSEKLLVEENYTELKARTQSILNIFKKE